MTSRQYTPAAYKAVALQCYFGIDLLVRRDFTQKGLQSALNALYGEKPPWRGRVIVSSFHQCIHAGKKRRLDQSTLAILDKALADEYGEVLRGYSLFVREHVLTSAAARQARLAPADTRYTWIIRRGNAIEGAIDRKVKTIMRMAREFQEQVTGGELGKAVSRWQKAEKAPG